MQSRKVRERQTLAAQQLAVCQALEEQVVQSRKQMDLLQENLRQKYEELGARNADVRGLQDQLHHQRDYSVLVQNGSTQLAELTELRSAFQKLQTARDSEVKSLQATMREQQVQFADITGPAKGAHHKIELELQRQVILLEFELGRTQVCNSSSPLLPKLFSFIVSIPRHMLLLNAGQELRAQLESERRRANEAVHDNSELRQLLMRASATLGEQTRSLLAPGPRDGVSRTSGHAAMSTPMRAQYPVVDNVRRKLAAMADKDKVVCCHNFLIPLLQIFQILF